MSVKAEVVETRVYTVIDGPSRKALVDSFAASFDCVKKGGPLELTLKHPNHETLRGKVRIDAIYSVRHLDMTGNSFEVMGECRPYDAKGTRTFLSQYDTKKKSGWLQYDEVRKAKIYK